MSTIKQLAQLVTKEGYAPVMLHPEVRRLCELVRADEREQIIAKNAPEIERINAYIKTLEQHMNITTTYDEAMVKADRHDTQ